MSLRTLTLAAALVALAPLSALAAGTAGNMYNLSCDTGTTGNVPLYNFTVGTQFTVRCKIIDQATGAGITTLTNTQLIIQQVKDVTSNTVFTNGTQYTIGAFTAVGGGVYDWTVTINSGVTAGDILEFQMRETGGTEMDAQRASTTVYMMATTAGVATNAHQVEVQPSTNGDVTAAAGSNYTLKVAFFDATGATYNPGTLTWTLNRWRDSGGATVTLAGGVTAAWNAGGWYDVTLNGHAALTAGNRQYITVQAVLGSYTFLFPLGLTAVTAQSTPALTVPTFTAPSLFANPATAAGTVTAAPSGCAGIAVSAPYTGDSNGNNTLSYRWRTPTGNPTWSVSTILPHSASPYGFTISGLTAGASYDVEVTYADADGVSGIAIQTVSNIVVGANCTAAGTVTVAQVAGATPSLGITAPYTLDGNANNTGSYRTRTPTGTGAWTAATPVAHSASPYQVTVSGLTCGASYDVEWTYADADGLASGTAVQTVTNVVLTNCSIPAAPSGVVNSCSSITVSAPFSNDANANGTTAFARGPSATGPWTAVAACGAVAGASPRTCTDTTVAALTTYYFQVTVSDADGVGGTNPQVTGALATPTCVAPPVKPGVPTVTATTCGALSVSAPFQDDTNGNSTTTVSHATSSTGPWTVDCASLVGASPRTCALSGLADAAAYYVKVDFADPDGVNGLASQIVGPTTTVQCRVTPGTPTASAASCSQLTVTAPFTGDANGNSTTAVAHGLSATGPWTTPVACAALTGASPRVCNDTGLTGSTAYYVQVTFADVDGVLGTTPTVIGPVSTPACTGDLVLSGTPQPAGASVTAGSTGTYVAKLTLTASAYTATVSELRVQNTGTALGGADVAELVIYDDGNGNGLFEPAIDTTVVGVATWSASLSRYVARSLSYTVAAGTPRTLFVTLDAATTAVAGRTFIPSVAAADVVAVAPSLVTGGPVAGNTFTLAGGSTQGGPSGAPMVLVLNPSDGVSVSGTFRLQVQVHTPGGALTSLAVSKNGGADGYAAYAFNLTTDLKAQYAVGTNAAVYETSLAWPAGGYALKVRATNAAGTSTSGTLVLTVNAAGAGDGNLLRRDNSSQLCLDCHALPTHSSQSTSTQYGAWAMACRTCHQPHNTRNIFLVREQLATPNGGGKTVALYGTGGKAANSFVDPAGSGSGVCEACHTKTANWLVPGAANATFVAGGTTVTCVGTCGWSAATAGGLVKATADGPTAWTAIASATATTLTLAEGYRGASATGVGYATRLARYRSTGDTGQHYTQNCIRCHSHGAGFAAAPESTGGQTCGGCHFPTFEAMNGTTPALTKHTLGNVLGVNDAFTDTTASWGNPLGTSVAPANRSCVNMCHDDHVHNAGAGTTHEYSAYQNASTQANRAATSRLTTDKDKTDFEPTGAGGMCVSCHSNPVDATHPAVPVATYAASAHNTTSAGASGTWRYTMHDGSDFLRNCTKCHAGSSEKAPQFTGAPMQAVHWNDNPSLLAGTTNPAGNVAAFICYNCHGSGLADGGTDYSGKNIAKWIGQPVNHPANADTVHNSATEAAAAFGTTLGVAGRHSSCLDCHEPHAAKAGTHTIGGATGNLAGPPLQGAQGVALTNPAFWTAPAAANFTAKLVTSGTDPEANLCFRCHSSFYGTLPMSPSGGYAETDTAKEFNPANAGNWGTTGTPNAWSANETAGGFHPVLASAANNLGAVKLAGLSTANFAWSTTVRNTMTCTDCHESSNVVGDPNGPHGSANPFILRGPNTAWNVGLTLTGTTPAWPATVFCLNCHQQPSAATSRYPDHANNVHNAVPCWNCHGAIPHGGPRMGMLVAAAGADPGVGGVIAGWDQTAPYSRPGAGNKLYIVSYPTNATTDWQQNNCGCNGTGH